MRPLVLLSTRAGYYITAHISQYGGRHYRVSEVTAILVPQVLQILSENRSLALLTLSDGDRHRYLLLGMLHLRPPNEASPIYFLTAVHQGLQSHPGYSLFEIATDRLWFSTC